jgi:hypothetical protein
VAISGLGVAVGGGTGTDAGTAVAVLTAVAVVTAGLWGVIDAGDIVVAPSGPAASSTVPYAPGNTSSSPPVVIIKYIGVTIRPAMKAATMSHRRDAVTSSPHACNQNAGSTINSR